MLKLKKSGVRQLLSSLWITHPHIAHPLAASNGRSILCDAEWFGGNPNAAARFNYEA